VSTRHVLHLVRPGAARADVPGGRAAGLDADVEAPLHDVEVRDLDATPADELVERVFAADLVVVW